MQLEREHACLAHDLVKAMHAANGLAPIDLVQFWADQEVAQADPFGRRIPQVAFGATLTGECVFDELGVPEDHWRYANDDAWRLELNRAYNDRAERIVGRRILGEVPRDPTREYPAVQTLADLFEARNEWHDNSWWLQQSAHSEAELSALLDRVERRLERPRNFFLPPEWDAARDRLMAANVPPPLYRGQRGPVTFATSIYGAEPFLLMALDNPTLTARLSDLILRGMLARAGVLDAEAGHTTATAPHGFWFADDNCCLTTPAMYEAFAFPILKGIFDVYSPTPADTRYQHSDSAMGHLLPILGRLDLTGTNFGPTVGVADIRRHLPRAVIHGELAPFTYSRNDETGIVMEFLRDHAQLRETRGLCFTTAGSINNGTRLTSMRLAMAAIQRYGRFDTL